MEENKKETELSPEGPKLIRGRLAERLDNFWYHYKWHTLAALFIIIVVVVCTLQMCSKEEYDLQVLYAGDKAVNRTSESGDIPDYNKIVSSLTTLVSDYDGNGEISVAFSDKYVLTKDQMAEIEAGLKPGESLPYQLLTQNSEDLGEMLVYGDFFLCFLSPEIYEQYRTKSEVDIFYDLSEVGSSLGEDAFYSSSAIKLSSLDFYGQMGISSLPEDTLVCLRGTISALNGKSAKEQFARSLETLEKIINYKAN